MQAGAARCSQVCLGCSWGLPRPTFCNATEERGEKLDILGSRDPLCPIVRELVKGVEEELSAQRWLPLAVLEGGGKRGGKGGEEGRRAEGGCLVRWEPSDEHLGTMRQGLTCSQHSCDEHLGTMRQGLTCSQSSCAAVDASNSSYLHATSGFVRRGGVVRRGVRSRARTTRSVLCTRAFIAERTSQVAP